MRQWRVSATATATTTTTSLIFRCCVLYLLAFFVNLSVNCRGQLNKKKLFAPYSLLELNREKREREREREKKKRSDHTLKCWHHYYLLPLIFIGHTKVIKSLKRNFVPSIQYECVNIMFYAAVWLCGRKCERAEFLIYCNLFIWLWALQSFRVEINAK